MKILFIRHGESTDDIDDQYGGWADFDLTSKGRDQLTVSAEEIKKLDIRFSKILHSPLKRAAQSAAVLSENLGLEASTLIWLKEMNKYGLLSGINKDVAKEEFPGLVQSMADGYVFGSEPFDTFVERVDHSLEVLKQIDQDIICVTHGGYLTGMINNNTDKTYVKAGDGGFVLFDVDAGTILSSFNFELA